MAREVRIEDHTVKEGEPSEKYIGPKKAQSVGEVTVNVDVDVSEALTCLKALQREARYAAKALRELEEVQMIEELKRKLVDKSITDDIRRSYE